MQKIPLKKAKTGMKLARPVTNERGMTLCGEGTELTEAIIARLVRMEVEHITVTGRPIKTAGGHKSVEQQLDEMHARFKRVEADPLMKKIKGILVNLLTEGTEEG